MNNLSLVKNHKIFRLIKYLDIPKVFFFNFTAICLLSSILELAGLGSLYALLLNFQNISEIIKIPIVNYDITYIKKDNFLVLFLFLFCFFFIVKSLVIIFLNYYIYKSLEKIKNKTYSKIFNNLTSINYLEIIKNGHIKYNQIFSRYLDDCFSGYLAPFIKLLSDIIILTSIFLFILNVNLNISLIVIAFLSFATYLSVKIFGPKLKKNSKISGISEEKSKNLIFEFIKNYKEIFVYSLQSNFSQSFELSIAKFFKSERKYLLAQVNIRNFFEIGIILLIVFIFSYFVFTRQFLNSISTIAILGFSFAKTIPYLNSIISNLNMMKQSFKGTAEILKYKKNANNKKNSYNLNKTPKLLDNLDRLEIVNLKFSYNGVRNIFNNLNLKIRNNQTICLLGPSGSGKTTLVDIVLGIIKPEAGLINFFDKNGNIIKNFNNFAYISQTPCIFKGSIIKNITFKENISDKETKKIKSILKNLGFFNYIKENSVFKKNLYLEGQNLSGGQKQKISIARAIYNNAQIVFIDEGTSNLDGLSEQKMLETINKIKKNKIIFFITHKISNKSFFDKIIYLNNKKIQ